MELPRKIKKEYDGDYLSYLSCKAATVKSQRNPNPNYSGQCGLPCAAKKIIPPLRLL